MVYAEEKTYKFDFFISHASEDKEDFVNPLVEYCKQLDLNVWYDAEQLIWGDDIRPSIVAGLQKSQFGLLVISQKFLDKQWTEYEYNTLFNLEMASGQKRIIPLLHGITREQLADKYPDLSGRLYKDSILGVENVAREMRKLLNIKKKAQEKTKLNEPKMIANTKEQLQSIAKNLIEESSLQEQVEMSLQQANSNIFLRKALQAETGKLIEFFTADFDELLNKTPSAGIELIQLKMDLYEEQMDALLSSMVSIILFGNHEQKISALLTLEKLVDSRLSQGGRTIFLQIQKYPTLLLFYVIGITSVLEKDFDTLRDLFLKLYTKQDYSNASKVEIIQELHPYSVIDYSVLNEIKGKKYHTPLSDHLLNVLQPYFSYYSERRLDEAFNVFEIILAGYYYFSNKQPFLGRFLYVDLSHYENDSNDSQKNTRIRNFITQNVLIPQLKESNIFPDSTNDKIETFLEMIEDSRKRCVIFPRNV
jgi:hypothetical protein